MADKYITELIGGNLPQLAPDLTWPSNQSSGQVSLSGINVQGSLQPVFSLTGRRALSRIYVANLTTETATVKLTIDGVVVWNDTYTAPANINLLGINGVIPETYVAESSILFEMQTLTDTSISVAYLARPIK